MSRSVILAACCLALPSPALLSPAGLSVLHAAFGFVLKASMLPYYYLNKGEKPKPNKIPKSRKKIDGKCP